jgi:hypothetical protein
VGRADLFVTSQFSQFSVPAANFFKSDKSTVERFLVRGV